ncbi:MAG: tRNA pseudouridine38-40 synthase [Verrucomicrobiota bacterium]
MPARLKLIISYDGASFAGWQSQAGGNAIQDHVEKAFARICSKPVRVHGAGRTDAGVHAIAQCAHVDLPTRRYSAERWVAALNGLLPPAIRIMRCRFVSEKFHARFSARGKIYRYRIWNASVLPPFENGRAWHVRNCLDTEAIAAAAQRFIGTHNFASFAANRGTPETDTVRTISAVTVRRGSSAISIQFEGNGFLYKMVRMMVGTTVRIGLGMADADEITSRLKAPRKVNLRGRNAAPAGGLFLIRVRY